MQESDFEYVARALKSICEELPNLKADTAESLPSKEVETAELGGTKE